MPRYPELCPLNKMDLKEIARMRDSDGYLLHGCYPTFDDYCIGEWQRSANTINKRLKRAGFGSKRTKKIERKKERATQSTEWLRTKYEAMKSSSKSHAHVSPSVSPNISSVSPLPSNNSSNSRKTKKQKEEKSRTPLTNINTSMMGTQNTKLSKNMSTEVPSISSGVAKKTQSELDVEFDRLMNS